MSPWSALGLFLGILFLSAVFSGSETGFYSLSRVRLDADARAGQRMARLIRKLWERDTGLLIALLIGNNLMVEFATHLTEHELQGVATFLSGVSIEIVVTLALTPVLFFFGELLPKDLFRRLPHRLMSLFAPVIALARIVFLPISLPLELLSRGLERLLGVREKDFARALGREQMLEVLREGARQGVLAPHAEELARNVLVLRETLVADIMVPWSEVVRVDLDADAQERLHLVAGSDYSRLPALRYSGGEPRVVGYVHQIDYLKTSAELDCVPEVRELPSIGADVPVDRALVRLRTAGQRLALVGSPEAPVGIVSLMDLVQTISGELSA